MSYTIPVIGTTSIIVPPGSTDSTTSLTLIGKNVPGYGQAININLMKMMQHFAGQTLPGDATPVKGQIWYDSANRQLKVYNGSIFKVISMIAFSSNQPLFPFNGELWWDTSISQLKIYTNSGWIIVGPSTLGLVSGSIQDNIVDNSFISHVVTAITISGTPVAVVTTDSFTSQNSYYGITRFLPGINLTTALGFNGDNASIGTLKTGNITAGNITASSIGNITTAITANTGVFASLSTSGNISATGNIFANTNGVYASGYYYANGVGFSSSSYSNANVASYLLANPPSSSTYSNSNVAAYLPTYSGNLTVGNLISSGQITGGYLNGTIGANVANTGAFTVVTTTGYVGIGNSNPTTALYVAGASAAATRLTTEATSASGATQPSFVFSKTNTTLVGNEFQGSINWSRTLTNSVAITSSIYSTGNNSASTPAMNLTYNAYTGHKFQVNNNQVANIDANAFTLSVNASIPTANVGSMTASIVTAGTIGNAGASLVGTLATAAQTNITSIGTLTGLTVNGTVSATSHTGALSGPLNGTVGETLANTGAFTSLTTTGNLFVNISTASISTTTGALKVGGGVGAGGNLYSGGAVYTTGGIFWANGAAYVTASGTGGGTVTSVAGTGTVSGITLSGTVTTSGSLTLGGTLSLTSGQVTSALGFTPTNYANSNVAAYLVANPQGGSTYSNANVAGYLIANPPLGTYSNTNVTQYLPTNTANVSAGNVSVTTKATVGNLVTTNGIYWSNGTAWSSGIVGSAISFTTSGTAPVSPTVGNFWYNSTTDILYQYVNDGASNFWYDLTTTPTLFGNISVTTKATVGNVVTTGGVYWPNGVPYSTTTVGSGTVTSVSGTGTVNGITLSGSGSSSVTLTLGGTLSLTSGQVTTALGFTPTNYANSNVAGYLVSNPPAGTYSNSNVAGYLVSNPPAGTYSNANVSGYLVLNPQPGTYSNTTVSQYLPTHSGNLKANYITITSGITWANGTAWSSGSTGGAAGTLASRSTNAVTSSVMAPTAYDATKNITGYKSYALLAIETDYAAWVTLYTSSANRTSDLSRSITTDPTPSSGVIAEAITTGAQKVWFSPAVLGYSTDGTINIPVKIYNNGAGTTSISVTLTLVQLEA